jgi:hypothetical protein
MPCLQSGSESGVTQLTELRTYISKLKATGDTSKGEHTQGNNVTGTCSRCESTQIPVPELVRSIPFVCTAASSDSHCSIIMTFLEPVLLNLTEEGDFTQNAIGFRDLCNCTLAISVPDHLRPAQGLLNTRTVA